MNVRRLKILVLAYMISPKRGSEYAVAWNHVTWMSQFCDLTVIYGSAGSHMGNFEDMDEPAAQAQLSSVRFIPVQPPRFARWLNAANCRGWMTYSFYLAYQVWHRQAGRVARKLIHESAFDVVHYLGPIGYREPGTLWQLELPYVWGPIGGTTNLPLCLTPALPISGRLKLACRAIANWYQLRFSRRVRQALCRADILLTATTENQSTLERVLSVRSKYLPENGIVGEVFLNKEKFESITNIRLIWIGTVDARKALKILVDAFSKMRAPKSFVVHVVGDGPLRRKLQQYLIEKGLSDRFIWHGQVDRASVQQLLGDAHLHVITSVSEGNPTTVWEAMACGVPTLTIDHCGMHDTVRNHAGLKVALGPYDSVVQGFADNLDALAEAPHRLRAMADLVVKDSEEFHWRRRSHLWLELYQEAVKVHSDRRSSLSFKAVV